MPRKQRSYVFTATALDKPEGYAQTFVRCVEVPVYAHGEDVAGALRNLQDGLRVYLEERQSAEAGSAVEQLARRNVTVPRVTELAAQDLAQLPRRLETGIWQVAVPAPGGSGTRAVKPER